jgi:phenylpropionate dioxygenase-like ring-hydroxylating dioxygenase large terminal subunit
MTTEARAATHRQKAARTVPSGKAGRDARRSLGRLDWASWPSYEAAALGYRGYWYPVTWSKHVRGGQPRRAVVCGERLVVARDPGGLTVVGERPADDGAQRRYPAEERLGLVWVYIGDGDAPPVEADIPSELLATDAVVVGRLTTRPGNWRFGAENGFDEGHAKFLHRRSLWTLRRQMPTWTRHHIEPTGEGWITRVPDEVHHDTRFPGLGTWPPHRPWRTKGRGKATVSIRMPCFLRVAYAHWQHYEWWVPIDAAHHLYLQLVSKRAGLLERLRFRLYYRLWVRWVFHGLFNDEDALMVDVMDAPPERLYRPDIAITEWRKLCETTARGAPQTATPDMVTGLSERPIEGTRRAGLPVTHRLRDLLGR